MIALLYTVITEQSRYKIQSSQSYLSSFCILTRAQTHTLHTHEPCTITDYPPRNVLKEPLEC